MAPDEPSASIDAAKFAAYQNGSYHADREGILDRRHRVMMFLVIALGTTSVVGPFGSIAQTYSGVITALIGAVDLAFGFSIRARNHAYLRKEYFRIAAAVASRKCKPLDAEAKMMELAADEEPIFMAAHAIAENWAMKAVYGDKKPLPCEIGWLRRQFRHLFLMTDVNFSVKKK